MRQHLLFSICFSCYEDITANFSFCRPLPVHELLKIIAGSGLFEYGNFRAPPRDQREVRSGNKTHTFR